MSECAAEAGFRDEGCVCLLLSASSLRVCRGAGESWRGRVAARAGRGTGGLQRRWVTTVSRA
eukprot:6390953-Pyramimonas_sp.AAC.1